MNRKILLIVLALAFVGYAAYGFMDSVTPYVGIAEAKSATGNVQVKGVLDKSAPAPHMEGGDFVFSLQDEETGETMTVHYHGMKPDQFDEAVHIVAIGSYREGAFESDKLLIKCPSKYESMRGKS